MSTSIPKLMRAMVLGVIVPASIVAAEPPGNDACSQAQYIGLGAFNASNIEATIDGDDSCRGATGPDVWYRFTSACSGVLMVDTCDSEIDTVLSVHSACPGAAGNELACNDDATGGPCPGWLDSYVEIPVSPYTDYYIRVAGFMNETGSFRLNLAMAAPANDACADAEPIYEGTWSSGGTCAATNEFVGGACGLSPWSPDVWYSFVPTCSGVVTVDTCGSNYDTVLGLYLGGCGGLTEVACNDDAVPACDGSIRTSRFTAGVTAGQNYLIRVAGYLNTTGTFQLNVGNVVAPNDACSAAWVVGNGFYSGSTCAATVDGAASCGLSNISPDVWFRWTAPTTGILALNTCGSAYDTTISAYTGTCGALTEIGCNDDGWGAGPCPEALLSVLSVPVTAGQEYYIRVSGYGGNKGEFTLSIHQQPNDDCRDALSASVGSTPFDTRGATTDLPGSCGLSSASPDIWYRFTAPCRGTVEIDTCGSAYDTVLSAYIGECGFLTEVICNDDAPAGPCPFSPVSRIAFAAEAGQAFMIRVSGYNGQAGTGWMNIAMACGCDPDVNCDGAVNGFDVEAMEQAVNGDFSNFCQADPDYNRDGAINGFDIEAVEQGVNGAPCP